MEVCIDGWNWACHYYIESATTLSDMDTNTDHFTPLMLPLWGSNCLTEVSRFSDGSEASLSMPDDTSLHHCLKNKQQKLNAFRGKDPAKGVSNIMHT